MGKSRDIADGTRYVDASGDTMTGGIFTKSAVTGLQYSGSGVEPFANAFQAAGGSGRVAAFVGTTSPSVWWADNTGGTQKAVGAVDGISSASGGGLQLWANDQTTTWHKAVEVNGGTQSPGSVHFPKQPIISGQIGTAMTSPDSDQLIAFNQFWVSRGISYNSSTRRFTVPIAGVYRITMNPFFRAGAAAARVLIGVNTDSPTTTTHYGHAYRQDASYDTGCVNSVVSLGAGDFIVFRLTQGGLYNLSADRFNQFSIEKIA